VLSSGEMKAPTLASLSSLNSLIWRTTYSLTNQRGAAIAKSARFLAFFAEWGTTSRLFGVRIGPSRFGSAPCAER